MIRRTVLATLLCLCCFGCGKGTYPATTPLSFPPQLLTFTGPTAAFGLDGKAWDAYGIGGPSNLLFLNGNYWMCVAGYPSPGFTAEAIGCWYGPDLTSMKPYAGNPVIVNSYPGWAASCIEGPDLNTDGVNVYISVVGFYAYCDAEGTGTIGIVSASVANFPAKLSALPASPQIPQPSQLAWLYRPFITEINGICLDYSNGGTSSGQPAIVSFKTSGPCATTEMNPSAWTFNRVELTITQGWEGPSEIQDPQVFPVAGVGYAMVYGGSGTLKGGYAYTADPVNTGWTKLTTNPIQADGDLWLPRIVQDATGQYWMFGNFNNTTQMNLWKASGS